MRSSGGGVVAAAAAAPNGPQYPKTSASHSLTATVVVLTHLEPRGDLNSHKAAPVGEGPLLLRSHGPKPTAVLPWRHAAVGSRTIVTTIKFRCFT